MKLVVDKEYENLGIEYVVASRIKGFKMCELSSDFEEFLINQEKKALSLDYEDEIISGYMDMIKNAGRSLNKFPPTAKALIGNVKRRGSLMRINPVVDIYNGHTIDNHMAIGAHDVDKISGDIHFTFADEGKAFYPIGGGEKKTVKGDFVYRDDNGILAMLDARDSELYKIDEDSTDIILIIQGNRNTDVSYRVEALKKISEDIISSMGGIYEILTVKAGEQEGA